MDAAVADVSLVFVLNSDRHLGSRGESESVFDESVRVADHDEDAEAVRLKRNCSKSARIPEYFRRMDWYTVGSET